MATILAPTLVAPSFFLAPLVQAVRRVAAGVAASVEALAVDGADLVAAALAAAAAAEAGKEFSVFSFQFSVRFQFLVLF